MRRRKAPDWLTQWEYAHRGLHGTAPDGSLVPENTLLGAQLAIKAALGVECDVQRSADDQAVVFHDWDLLRLASVEGETGRHTAEELASLPLLATDERLATLERWLELVGGRAPVLIEIKSKPGYDVVRSCKIVRETLRDYSGEHAVMSFDPRAVRWFRKNAPEKPVGLVMREDEYGYTQKAWQRHLALWIAKPDFLAYHVHALPSRWVEKLRANGLLILTWTISTPELRQRARAHADVYITEADGFA